MCATLVLLTILVMAFLWYKYPTYLKDMWSGKGKSKSGFSGGACCS